MLPLTRLRIVAIAAALLLPPATATAEPRGPTEAAAPIAIVVPLEPVDASGVGGVATIAPDPSQARRAVLALEAEGLQPGAAYPVQVHAGSPARPSASFGLLGGAGGGCHRARTTRDCGHDRVCHRRPGGLVA